MNISETRSTPPLVVGEVLYDEFEDGTAVLGGAPFNVAWHMHGLGADPLFISRVGRDKSGEDVLAVMRNWGMDTRGMQFDEAHPTGSVKVTLTDGQPGFDIVPDVAYDHIALDQSSALVSGCQPAMFYHGSLLVRTPAAQQMLSALIDKAAAPVFVDINLRPPHWSHDILCVLMHGANWLKLNDQELIEISDIEAIDHADLVKAASSLQNTYKLDSVIVTQGADGAFMLNSEGVHTVAPVRVSSIVDTVGAGDAFSAIVMLGLLRHWQVGDILQRAVQFAAEICMQRGATSSNTEFYRKFRQEWGL